MMFVTTAIKLIKKGIMDRLEIKEINQKQLETELSLLKAQVNPHFFFNTLNNLYSLSLSKSKKVPEVILKLSEMMRYVLESAKKQKVGLEQEIEFINSYISLERLRYTDNCDISFKTSGNLREKMIAPMILVTFVENAFKHGSCSPASKPYVHIKLNMEGNLMKFSVKNSIGEINNNGLNNSSKTGLSNVRRRLDLLYPNRYRLDINKNSDSFEVYLELSL